MNIKSCILLFVLFGLTATKSEGQGTMIFQNLDFENGSIISIPTPGNPFAVQWAAAMPGWTGFLGTNQQSVITYNTLSLSVANISILRPAFAADIHNGQYHVQLQNAFPVVTDVPALAQTGTLPANSQSIRFYSAAPFAIGLTVTFSGTHIPLSLLGSTANNKQIWGGDISGFAGQTGELRFRGSGTLDFIQFSNQPVPEPNALGLIAIGALLFSYRSRLARRS